MILAVQVWNAVTAGPGDSSRSSQAASRSKKALTLAIASRVLVRERLAGSPASPGKYSRSCLKLAYAALQRAAERRQQVTITELEERRLELLAQQRQPDPRPAQRQAMKIAA